MSDPGTDLRTDMRRSPWTVRNDRAAINTRRTAVCITINFIFVPLLSSCRKLVTHRTPCNLIPAQPRLSSFPVRARHRVGSQANTSLVLLTLHRLLRCLGNCLQQPQRVRGLPPSFPGLCHSRPWRRLIQRALYNKLPCVLEVAIHIRAFVLAMTYASVEISKAASL